MAAFTQQTSAEANKLQQSKYSDLPAEMARRANMRKTHSGGSATTEEASKRAKLAWEKRNQKASKV